MPYRVEVLALGYQVSMITQLANTCFSRLILCCIYGVNTPETFMKTRIRLIACSSYVQRYRRDGEKRLHLYISVECTM